MADPLGRAIRIIAKYPGNILARTGISPNQLTLLGFLVNCAVAYFIAYGRLSQQVIGVFIWAAGFFDALDGNVARATGRVTVFGNFLDSVMDRYSDLVIYLGILLYFFKNGQDGYVVTVVIAMAGSVCVSYVRAKAESLGGNCEIGLMPRTVRIILLGAGFCFGQPFWALIIIAALSHITVIQRILYARASLPSGKS
jgi:CDP-diacylglycerol--glycerol-3-phosphate 3-phosphatidyltransferase